jgi:hypothetical protein
MGHAATGTINLALPRFAPKVGGDFEDVGQPRRTEWVNERAATVLTSNTDCPLSQVKLTGFEAATTARQCPRSVRLGNENALMVGRHQRHGVVAFQWEESLGR